MNTWLRSAKSQKHQSKAEFNSLPGQVVSDLADFER